MNAKPPGLIVAMVGKALTRETRLCLETRLDVYSHVAFAFGNIDPNAWGPGLFEAVGVIGRALRSLANGTNFTFDPKYVFVTTGDVWWPTGHVEKAVDILERNPAVGIVGGLSVAPAPIEHQDPVPRTTRGDRTIYRLAYAVGELIPLKSWCFSWSVIRREVLDVLEEEKLTYSARAVTRLRENWKFVS
jgi:hypothetical protein